MLQKRTKILLLLIFKHSLVISFNNINLQRYIYIYNIYIRKIFIVKIFIVFKENNIRSLEKSCFNRSGEIW